MVLAFSLFVLCGSFLLGPLRHIEPFFTYFYFFAWVPLLAAVVWGLVRKDPSNDLVEADTWIWLLPFSTTLWLLFETLNFRLNNWSYVQLPTALWVRWPGYALSFATVVPGILGLAALLESRGKPFQPAEPSRPIGRWCAITGLAMLALSLLFPRQAFPLAWGFLFFLLEPWVAQQGGHSLINDWRRGIWRRTGALLGGGLLAGIYWEACNYWAGAKWIYSVPYVGGLKLFEMPILGFIGFPAFALEVHAAYEAYRLKRDWLDNRVQVALILVFWLAAFWGIDRWTVVRWRAY